MSQITAIGTRPAAARKAVSSTTRVSAGDVRVGDTVVFKDGSEREVHGRRREGRQVTLEFRADYTRITVPETHPTTVVAEHLCDCGGTGSWSWGATVNGVPSRTGRHFACGGKGWMDRADLQRNRAYWNANGGRA